VQPIVQTFGRAGRGSRVLDGSALLRGFLGLAILAPSALQGQAVCVPPPAGLVSWWRGESTAADNIRGNDGLPLGTVNYISGEVGQAFSFSGSPNNCIRIPYSASLGSPAYTLETWVSPVAPVSDPADQKVLFAQNAGRVQLLLRPGTAGARVVFQFFTGSGTWRVLAAPVEIPLNQFSHLAASWDGGIQRLYVNGVLVASATSTAPPWDPGCDFFIGGIASTTGGEACQYSGQFFQGIIDEVSYFRRALADSEVQDLFSAGSSGKCQPDPPVKPLVKPAHTPDTLAFDLRTRDPASGEIRVNRQVFRTRQLAVLVMDVWNSHPDPDMASRSSALIPQLNQGLDAARAMGIPVIFCPNEVEPPPGADTRKFAALPTRSFQDNGFDPTLPSYGDSEFGDMVPVAYDVAYRPRFGWYTSQHPDLVVRPGDLASTSRQQIFNFCAARGITHLLYTGVAANMCVCYTRPTSMVPMKRYCGLEPILVRDLTDSMTLNGRKRTGTNDTTGNIDLTMTPDRGHQQVVAQDETYICPSIDSRQLLQYWPPAAYQTLVTGDPQLLCSWRMESKVDYQEILDSQRTQSCWWNRNDIGQTAALGFGASRPGTNNSGNSVTFKGTTLLVSPLYRDDLPTNSPLVSLSATNFTFETWVRPSALNSNQWFFSHDNGGSNGIDVLFGLSANNRFQFFVGSAPEGNSFGDVLQGTLIVSPEDVDGARWFHVVAVHDREREVVSLYVNGKLDASGSHACRAVSLLSAPHFGSRGPISLAGARFLTNTGFEFFYGAMADFAIYSAALPAETISSHYQAALGQIPGPFALDAQARNGALELSWSAWPLGLRLQTSSDGGNWSDASLPVKEVNGRFHASTPIVRTLELFRLAEP
jgi:nicotinamidase-related amidase